MALSKFEVAWGSNLVVAPEGTLPPELKFLESVGLPSPLVYGDVKWPGRISFEQVGVALETVESFLGEEDTGDPTQRLLVIGEEDYEGGAAALWCIEPSSANVVRFDIDTGVLKLVNATPENLGEALLVLRDWVLVGPESRHVEGLRRALGAIGAGSPHWLEFCAYVDSLPGADVIFRVADV